MKLSSNYKPRYFANRESDPLNIIHYGMYHPYHGGQNPAFDHFSKQILALKRDEQKAIDYFYNLLNEYLNENFAIVTVPSHDPYSTINGLRNLALKLVKNKYRGDATSCLVRVKKIEKLSTGGDRSIDVHLNSIVVQNPEFLSNNIILLMDDVTTSGNSLLACKKLLLNSGASLVQMFALGQTV